MLLLNHLKALNHQFTKFNLHFNMLLLNPILADTRRSIYLQFTFQYASIKPVISIIIAASESDLHFNMLLLNRAGTLTWIKAITSLHFNMLLLNLSPCGLESNLDSKFTFQYASIKPIHIRIV